MNILYDEAVDGVLPDVDKKALLEGGLARRVEVIDRSIPCVGPRRGGQQVGMLAEIVPVPRASLVGGWMGGWVGGMWRKVIVSRAMTSSDHHHP